MGFLDDNEFIIALKEAEKRAGGKMPLLRQPTDLAQSKDVDAYEEIIAHAGVIFRDRNAKYKGNWRRYGWRSCLHDLRRKVDRCWDQLFNAPDMSPPPGTPTALDVDDLLDVINYAAITIMAIREGNRDGKGGWWS